jgi:hypothetical protein
MSAEQAKTPKLPKDPTQDGGTVDPDNIYNESTPEAAPETSGTGGTVNPTNIYNESTRQ